MTKILAKDRYQGEEGKRSEDAKGNQTNSFETFHEAYQENTTQTDRRT
jgi:hypothetical protein